MEACEQVGASLRIVGDGPDRRRLEAGAGQNVEFLGRLSDEDVRDEYRKALAVILPGEEDFGIVPVEAHACGRPVVALGARRRRGDGVEGENGVLFDEPMARRSHRRSTRCRAAASTPRQSRASAERFTRERHLHRMREVIDETIGRACGNTMVRRYNRLLVACYVVLDAILAMWAFILAYGIRSKAVSFRSLTAIRRSNST